MASIQTVDGVTVNDDSGTLSGPFPESDAPNIDTGIFASSVLFGTGPIIFPTQTSQANQAAVTSPSPSQESQAFVNQDGSGSQPSSQQVVSSPEGNQNGSPNSGSSQSVKASTPQQSPLFSTVTSRPTSTSALIASLTSLSTHSITPVQTKSAIRHSASSSLAPSLTSSSISDTSSSSTTLTPVATINPVAQNGTSGLKPATIAGIAISVVIGVIFLISLVALLIVLRRRHSRTPDPSVDGRAQMTSAHSSPSLFEKYIPASLRKAPSIMEHPAFAQDLGKLPIFAKMQQKFNNMSPKRKKSTPYLLESL